jgi:hypothetical protein
MKNIIDSDKLIEKLQQTEEGRKLIKETMVESGSPTLKRVTDILHLIACNDKHQEDSSCRYIEEEVNEDPWVMASHIEWIEKTSDIGTLCNIDDISDMEKILTGVRSSISSAGSLGLKSLSLLRVVIMLADPDETMDIVMMMKWIEK